MDNLLLHKLTIKRIGKRFYPLDETTIMALGLTKSVSNRVRLSLPSKLATSMLSGDESTQNINLRWTSTAKPSGLSRSPKKQRGHIRNVGSMIYGTNKGSRWDLLLELMRISGSDPETNEALFIVLADKSVQ